MAVSWATSPEMSLGDSATAVIYFFCTGSGWSNASTKERESRGFQQISSRFLPMICGELAVYILCEFCE